LVAYTSFEYDVGGVWTLIGLIPGAHSAGTGRSLLLDNDVKAAMRWAGLKLTDEDLRRVYERYNPKLWMVTRQ
jgi:hypothetical protein